MMMKQADSPQSADIKTFSLSLLILVTSPVGSHCTPKTIGGIVLDLELGQVNMLVK